MPRYKILYIDQSSYLMYCGKLFTTKSKAEAGNIIHGLCGSKEQLYGHNEQIAREIMSHQTMYDNRSQETFHSNTSRRFKQHIKAYKKQYKRRASLGYIRKPYPNSVYIEIKSKTEKCDFTNELISFKDLKEYYVKSIVGPGRYRRYIKLLKLHFTIVECQES